MCVQAIRLEIADVSHERRRTEQIFADDRQLEQIRVQAVCFVRPALGANRGEVLRMVMSQAGRLAVTGVAIGLAAAVIASRAIRSQLFQVAPTDTLTYVVVGGGLLMVALLASWIPARRAARIDPLAALRHD